MSRPDAKAPPPLAGHNGGAGPIDEGQDAIERMIALLARLPGLGPRSARRAVLAMLRRPEQLLLPLGEGLVDLARTVRRCADCGNYGTGDRCAICLDERRDGQILCVVEDVADLWAMERAGVFSGRYHVLGGLLSALEGVGPEELGLPRLENRIRAGAVREVVLALPATVDGRTTAHYIAERLSGADVTVSTLALGVPVGGELDYLDEGTITAALKARRPL